ncbi:MAG: class I SAM-dependent methyltransferase [Thermoleophilia bacterium]|nr:class I SAM-dependent methyltransferase [Thermoleophilia bacterium]
MSLPLVEKWLAAVLATPGLTAITDVAAARATLLDDALKASEIVAATDGPIIDVGSGGGTPGIPLAALFPDRPVTLLEAEHRKCAFLETWMPDLPNLSVVWGRAEEQEGERFGVAVAKALAHPPTAAEWCLPLVRDGGLVVLWVGETAEEARVARVAELIAGVLEPSPPGLFLIRKTGPTPDRFPRRTGVARKRPLA